jgi:hypothetical protein
MTGPIQEVQVKRTESGDAVVLCCGQTRVSIRRPAAEILVLVIRGSAARDIGAPMFEEIAAAFSPGRKISLFIDLEQAHGTPVTVERWVRFLSANLAFISRVHLLAVSRATSLSANVIDHFIRKDGLFEIFDEPERYQASLAAKMAASRPLP